MLMTLREFIEWTAWPMERPASYGAFHLTFLFVGLAVVALLCFLLRKTSERANKAVLVSCGAFLIITEVYKHLFYYYVIGNGTYQWWIFPFQLCSVPMYLCLIAPFLKKGKVQDALYNFLLAFNLMGGFISFLEPSGLTHEYYTLTWHAFIWHMSLVFVGAYLGVSGRACKKLSDYKGAITVYGVLCAIAFTINILLRNKPGVNMFYIGPIHDSPIIVFKEISARFGWYVNTPIYIACTCAAAFIIYFIFYKVKNRKNNEGTATENE